MSVFWDEPLALKKDARIRLAPPIPETGWRRPSSFPNLVGNMSVLAFDTETYDPNLDVLGPGWGRSDGHIVGVSLGAEDQRGNRGAWYFPCRHEIGSEDNFDPANLFGWLGEVMATPNVPKIGANTTYDFGWLGEEGVHAQGELHDVQFAEALIDNEAFVALDVLAWKYLGRGKTSGVLYDWIREAYPKTPETKLRKNIYRTPPKLVGPYAEDDANHPLDIYRRQAGILQYEGLDYVYRLECDLIPMMVAMRRRGVAVDVAKATQLLYELQAETKLLYDRIEREYGFRVLSMASGEIAPLLRSVGIQVPLTAAGGASVQKEWLAGLEHPLGELLNDIREQEKVCGTFLQSYIIDKNRNGYLHPQFHQLHNDDSGTKVGRFSSSEPNLQNIPVRTKLGKRVRESFVPGPGHVRWRKHDYSQIHYRILAHYAVDDGDGSAEELRNSYRNNPNMDYHDAVYFRVAPLMGWDINDVEMKDFRRRPIKNVNFGLLYGQSLKALMYKTATYFGGSFTMKMAEDFFAAYFQGAPYVKPTMKAIGAEVQRDGFVSTLLGRRIRFHEWEPILWSQREGSMPTTYESAIRQWGPSIRRAYEYRGVNYKFQGSEPDIMKHGMRDLWRSGVLKYVGVPCITVHDELDWPERDDSPEMAEAFRYVQHVMQNTIQLRVPVKVDATTGINWGKAK